VNKDASSVKIIIYARGIAWFFISSTWQYGENNRKA